MVAYLIKQTAKPGSELERTMARFKAHNTDLDPEYEFYFDAPEVGLKMVKAVMQEKYGPKGHIIRRQARDNFLGIYRKFREEIKDYLERYDMAKRYWERMDPDYKQPEELFAKQLLWNSGLTREETN